jgi:hypothetical protein
LVYPMDVAPIVMLPPDFLLLNQYWLFLVSPLSEL